MMNSRILCCSRLLARCSFSKFTAVGLPFNGNNVTPVAYLRNFSTKNEEERQVCAMDFSANVSLEKEMAFPYDYDLRAEGSKRKAH